MITQKCNLHVGMACLAATLLLGSRASADKPNAVVLKPNIIFIMLDDLGKEWVGCYGAEEIKTPHVDALAARGMQFKNAYSMPQCTPSRVALMTGQYPFKSGWINHWDVPRWGNGCHFDWDKNPSVARVMKSAGYVTAVAGKWQVNDFRVYPEAMVKHGFDEYCMWTGYETKNPPSGKRYWDPYIHTSAGSKTHEGKFGEDIFSDFLIDFMKRNKDQPMFIYYPMCLPHTPFTTTPLEPDAKGDDKYKAMIRYTDHILGKITKAVDDLGIRDNTIIIWTTDNGSTKNKTGIRNGRSVKGGKTLTTENGICAPFIVNCPGMVPAGIVSDALIDFTDMLPTFAELGGAELPTDYEFSGHSAAGVMLGREEDTQREWILAMGGASQMVTPPACGVMKLKKSMAKQTDKGVVNQHEFRDRVIRNKRYKLFIDINRKPVALVDVINDPEEKINLLTSGLPAAMEALRNLKEILALLPEEDANPSYNPQPDAWSKATTSSKKKKW